MSIIALISESHAGAVTHYQVEASTIKALDTWLASEGVMGVDGYSGTETCYTRTILPAKLDIPQIPFLSVPDKEAEAHIQCHVDQGPRSFNTLFFPNSIVEESSDGGCAGLVRSTCVYCTNLQVPQGVADTLEWLSQHMDGILFPEDIASGPEPSDTPMPTLFRPNPTVDQWQFRIIYPGDALESEPIGNAQTSATLLAYVRVMLPAVLLTEKL
jgi:hypothetical protein